MYTDLRIIVPMAVVDGPLVGVSLNGGTSEMQMIPWVRMLRNEPASEDRKRFQHLDSTKAIDIVHFDALHDYVSWLKNLANSLTGILEGNAMSIATGKGILDLEKEDEIGIGGRTTGPTRPA